MNVPVWVILKWLWDLLGWIKSLLVPAQGPAITIASSSLRERDRQSITPSAIVFENSGTTSAFNVECESRQYYDPMVPPTYEVRRTALTTALKPGETFTLKLFDGRDDVALLYRFELFIRYQNLRKQSLLSHTSVGLDGRVLHRDHAVNPFRRLTLRAEIWWRHFLSSLWVHTKVKYRTRLYRLATWVLKRVAGHNQNKSTVVD